AKAQVMFECWMQEQEEDIQPEDIAACRADFYAAMAALKLALAPKMVAAKPAPAPAPAPAPKPMALTGPYTVFFDFDSAELTAAAPAVVQKVISDFEKVKPSEILLSGHADRAGSSAYNMVLSKERLDAVAAALKEGGVPSLILTKTMKGEYNPRVATPDGQRNEANRRVEVTFKR
ncbi:MAG: OmpA family protein, partial [Rhodospirillales bacterium]|nr:OmpA family protein [Rhodospirillales bacterium]